MAYIFDTSKGETPEIIAQRRKLSDALAARIFGRTPQNVGEGLSAIGQAWIASTMRDEADAAQKSGQASGNAAFANLFGGSPQASPQSPMLPATSATSAPATPSQPQIVDPNQVNSIDAMADLPPSTQAMLPKAQNAIAGIESGGRYGELGPVTKTGDRAYGKYQVMGANIPQWTKETLGREMTPQEFVAAPDAQDAVFNAKFGNYMQKYGPEGASKAWFAGEGGMKNPNAADVNGMTVANYGKKFTGAMGAEDASIPAGARPTQAQATVPQSAGPDLNTLIQASTNPWLSEPQRAVVNTMLQQKLKEQQLANDPLHQLQIQKAQADLQYGKNPESVREYQFAKEQGFNGTFQDWIATKRGGAGNYGLTPIWGTGPDNKPALIQLGKDGKPLMPQLPDGFSIARDPIKVEGPTGTSILDPQTRQVIQFIPKDVRGAAREHVIGDSQGKIQSTLPSDILSANQTVSQIDQLLGNKGLDAIVGPLDQFRPSWTLGSEGRDALARFNQLKGKAFLQAYSTLRGGGAITEVEGVKAENAMARMDRAQSEEDFRTALKDFRDAVSVGLEKLKEKGGVAPNATGAMPPPGNPGSNTTSGGVKWSVE